MDSGHQAGIALLPRGRGRVSAPKHERHSPAHRVPPWHHHHHHVVRQGYDTAQATRREAASDGHDERMVRERQEGRKEGRKAETGPIKSIRLDLCSTDRPGTAKAPSIAFATRGRLGFRVSWSRGWTDVDRIPNGGGGGPSLQEIAVRRLFFIGHRQMK